MHVLVAGCGWLGRAVAQRLLERGDRVTGARTTGAGAAELEALGLEALALDLAAPGAADRIPGDVDAILALQAARGGGEDAYRRAYVDVNRTLLEAARRLPLRALVHSGSTGIFGQADGSDVDETTSPLLASASSRLLAEGEALLQDGAAAGLPTRIVRLSGLYGPGRTWMLERVRQGLMGLGAGDGTWMNACHQDDAVTVLLAALDRGRDGAIYHATDAEPLRRRDLVNHVAARLGLAPSRVDLAPGGPDRRVLGLRTRAELQVRLRWPSLREGLEPFCP
jgi:nucleoside-diphosphate-sugar epimerase